MANRFTSTTHHHQHPAPRPRRIDDALSQLVDSLLPPLPRRRRGNPENDDDDDEDEEEDDEDEDNTIAEDLRRQRALERAWEVLDNNAAAAAGTAGAGVVGAGATAGAAVTIGGPHPPEVNNASDLIKRKLLRENASPDKAVRFSNLYSRLLTQPVLAQKWAILYLLSRLGRGGEGGGGEGGGRGGAGDGGNGRRSPLLEEHQLENMLGRGRKGVGVGETGAGPGGKITSAGWDTGLESPGPNASASQWGGTVVGGGGGGGAGTGAGGVGVGVGASRGGRERRPTAGRGYTSARESPVEVPETVAPAPRPQSQQHQHTSAHTTPTTAAPSPIHGVEPGETHPPESALLHDLPFNLQGVSSTNLEFTSPSTVKLPPTLPLPLLSLLHTLAEPCLLYRNLSNFVESAEGGLVGQSLRAAIGNELRSYLGLVATLEGEIRRALAAAAAGGEGEVKSVARAGVTLKRCVVWTREATMALRLMALMVEEAESKKGGKLISMIHGLSSSHGDPFVCAFAERLLTHVTRPFYDMMRQWIYDGELSDPYHEFFVAEPDSHPSADPRRIATSVWEDKYKLDDDMVPTIITQDFAKKVFLIGKSLNFIRYGCGDSAWVEAYSKDASKELRYGDTATLEISIDEAYKTTMERLIYLMDTRFKLFDHLKALKKYLLLGQGDFINLLMESLASNLDRPANSQYRHTLTAQLEHAIRSSNAQYDSPDVLRRLDARMLELSHGEIGWDCFTLEYKIDAPVDVVITPWGSTQYLKVFNFLWRIKRVEFALGSTWRRCMTGARGVLGSVDDKVGPEWKRARGVIAEMIHFICQLQYYILFEVIEASWDQLQLAISKPGCTLDDLIEAHARYLNSITHKGLLGSSSSSSSTSTSSRPSSKEDFLTQLHQIMKIMLSYKDAVDGLYSFSVAEFTRRQELSAKIEARTAQGKWGVTENDNNILPPSVQQGRRRGHTRGKSTTTSTGTATAAAASSKPILPHPDHNEDATEPPPLPQHPSTTPGPEDHMLPSLRTRLRDLATDFKARLNVLLGDLAYQPDVDMRFLGVVMNFNDVYEPVRRRRGGGGGAKDGKERRAGGGTGRSRGTTAGAGTRSGSVSVSESKGSGGSGGGSGEKGVKG
ncbi:Microtubule-nucleating Tub4p (gamma-tubulin) complex component [Arachnomyces sp. PD_36]|nr:Microtubule-nucleating Tub4p (gamma-tubulin) complex component [Arachnomyces sp. PD_36]